jgi:hypothetical protein
MNSALRDMGGEARLHAAGRVSGRFCAGTRLQLIPSDIWETKYPPNYIRWVSSALHTP